MKKILIPLIFLLSIPVFSQTGTGWVPYRSKMNVRDSTYFYKDARFNGTVRVTEGSVRIGAVTVTANGTELNILDGALASTIELNYLIGVTSAIQTQLNAKANTSALSSYAPLANPNFTTAVRLASDSILAKSRIYQIIKYMIQDSMTARLNMAKVLTDYTWVKSDTTFTHKKPITYDQLVNYVGSGASASGKLQFIVGTTSGAPINGDTSMTHSSLANKAITAYRGTTNDMHLQRFNSGTSNVRTGYCVYNNSNGTVRFRPSFSTGETVLIVAEDPTKVSWLYFSGGASSLLTGLRAGWKLDESGGTALNDVLGVYNGTTTGTTGAAGKFGYAESFVRSSSQWASLGTTVGDLGTSDFSICAWFNISSSPSATMGICGNVEDAPYYYIGINSGDYAYAVLNFGGSNITLTGNSALSTGQWYHMTLTCDRNGNAILYVNGSSQTDVKDISSGVAVSLNTNNGFGIGTIGSLMGYTFNGYTDDVYLYTKVLSGAEVTELQTKTYPFN